MSEKRANKVLGIVLAVIAVVALIVVVSVKEPVAQLDKNSPEGVVQQYLGAVTDGDFNQALTYLVSDSKCTVEDFDRAYIDDSVRIGLSETSANEATAVVTVSIESSNGDPFGGTYSEERNFRLIKSVDGWKISGIPWPTYECGGEYK
jgi:type II secretory pathway pseudopilin PulG